MDQKELSLGLEFGSTRIKATLIDRCFIPVAEGSFEWENSYENGVWTYPYSEIIGGMRDCYADLKKNFADKYGVPLTTFGAAGVSGMMHGYIPLGPEDQPLAPFRTWRNTLTGRAASELTGLFGFNIPQRWSIAHLYQAALDGERHLFELRRLATVSVLVHLLLTGEYVAGIGEASGMFPVDPLTNDYDVRMERIFDGLIADRGYPWKLRRVLPRVLCAGELAGRLTPFGAAMLDPSGDLKPGVPFAPPEGDAGTGMVATDSVAARTGNVSAGTSDFAMIVTDRPMGVHREIDVVATPAGLPVAMVHCNNCTSDINAWAGLFGELASALGSRISRNALFELLFTRALEGDPDCGGLMNYNYVSGEGVTGLDAGRPLFTRTPDSRFTLSNFMRTQLLSALATLKIGLDILVNEENIPIDTLRAHGGFFRTREVGQRMLSAAVGAPVSVTATAGEGGPYGMALLASYMLMKEEGETLERFLADRVFANARTVTVTASGEDIAGFAAFLERYKKGLPVERAAAELL